MKTQNAYEKYYQDKRTKDLQITIYGYSPPSNGKYNVDGKEYDVGEDFRTVERYQEYVNAGMNTLLMQSTGVYRGEEWETSQTKRVMDNAYAAGIKKIIVLDDRVYWLSRSEDGLFGDGEFNENIQKYGQRKYKFKDEAELDAYLIECMKPYVNHPAFDGMQIVDEPPIPLFKSISQLWKALKRVCPKGTVHCNLFPLASLYTTNTIYPQGGDLYERFQAYLTQFVEATGADYVMYDNYPICEGKADGTAIHRLYFRGLQEATEVCQKKNVDLHFVVQSFGMTTNGVIRHRFPTEAEMYYQVNAVLGFGAKELSYFTYWNKADNNTKGEYFPDGEAIISRDGTRTPMYEIVKAVNAMAQKLAPVLMSCKYLASQYVLHTPWYSHPFHLEHTKQYPLKKIVEAETDQDVALINELYDEERNQYVYRVQNITYPYYYNDLPDPKQRTVITFADEFTKADVFDGKEWKTVELKNHQYTAISEPGYAEYILPY